MVAELDLVNLWDFFVLNVFGGFWLAILGISILMFMIMGVFGRMSKITTINVILLFVMSVSIGISRIFSILIGTIILVWFFIQMQKTFMS